MQIMTPYKITVTLSQSGSEHSTRFTEECQRHQLFHEHHPLQENSDFSGQAQSFTAQRSGRICSVMLS